MAKGGIAALLLGKPKEDEMEENESEAMAEEDEISSEGLTVASEEILEAIEGGDAGALKAALKSFIGQCD
jgi:hypothetical protein